MVDKAVSLVLDLELWLDNDFVTNIYNEKMFDKNVTQIYNMAVKRHFFTKYVKERFHQRLLLNEERLKNMKKNDEREESDETRQEEEKSQKIAYTHVAYFKKNNEHFDDIKHDDDAEHNLYSDENNQFEYHIYEMNMKHSYKEKETKIINLRVDHKRDDCEWVVWKKKTKGAVPKEAKSRNTPSYGFWEILDRDEAKKYHLEKMKGIPIKHLKTMYEFLRTYRTRQLKDKSTETILAMETDTELLTKSQASLRLPPLDTDDKLGNIYCKKKFEPRKVAVDIFIHEKGQIKDQKQENNDDDDNDKLPQNKSYHYQLIWWNCKKKTECNTFAFKNISANPDEKNDAIPERYYLRHNFSSLNWYNNDEREDALQGIKWEWYNNNDCLYKPFNDYEDERRGLFHKQIEATYQSNINDNFPWKVFDVTKPKKHSFNNAQIPHLKRALTANGHITITADGYLVRFTRLSYRPGDIIEEEKKNEEPKATEAINLIVNMEQVAVSSERGLFPRNIKRLKKLSIILLFKQI